MTGAHVEYVPYQEAGGRFPGITADQFEMAVHFIEPNGRISTAAEAVYRSLSFAPGGGWMPWAYARVPGFAGVSEKAYRFVAARRRGFSTLTTVLWGSDPSPSSYWLTRWFFLRALAVVYFIAFVSLGVQIVGLVGENGIAPAAASLERARASLGSEGYWRVPTLFWLGCGDRALLYACWGGAAAAMVLFLRILPTAMLAGMWGLYLSLSSVGSVFLSFQWDTLLLETGFLAIFLAPLTAFPRADAERAPSRIVLFLLRWLLFRLMFLSGLVKLTYGDGSWRDLSVLTFHYLTQPMPAWTSWYAHHWPSWFHEVSVAIMYVIELGLPFLMFGPRRPRQWAALGTVFLMVMIAATGNYNFFNLLTGALCLALLDDAFLARFLPARMRTRPATSQRPAAAGWSRTAFLCVFAATIVPIGAAYAYVGSFPEGRVPDVCRDVLKYVAPFRSINSYGLFRVMTTTRPEIVIEGSEDGATWHEYEFAWKPGDVMRAPGFAQPHQPRLDWQMWFAALGSVQRNPWVVNLMYRLLEGRPEVLGLMGVNPFEERPPRYVRALLYRYEFTDAETREETGAWWRREYLGVYCSPIERGR